MYKNLHGICTVNRANNGFYWEVLLFYKITNLVIAGVVAINRVW